MALASPANAYWHRYYAPGLVERALKIMTSCKLASTGVELHLDLYRRPEADAPVLILNHGGGGYGGLLVGLALACHERGYTVVVPDQKAQGRSGGTMGDFTIGEAVQNIVDVANWARREFNGPLYLAGGSLGGGLTYAAAAALAEAGTPPAAIECLNLYDFGDPRTGIRFSRLPFLADLPGFARAMRWLSGLLAKTAPTLRLPYRPLAKFRNMVDERDLAEGFYAKWKADPHTLRTVTARYMASLLDTPACVPLERNRVVRVMVVNQGRDKMISPRLTRDCYERLGGEKRYVEIDWGHFSLRSDFSELMARLGDEWIKAKR